MGILGPGKGYGRVCLVKGIDQSRGKHAASANRARARNVVWCTFQLARVVPGLAAKEEDDDGVMIQR